MLGGYYCVPRWVCHCLAKGAIAIKVGLLAAVARCHVWVLP